METDIFHQRPFLLEWDVCIPEEHHILKTYTLKVIELTIKRELGAYPSNSL